MTGEEFREKLIEVGKLSNQLTELVSQYAQCLGIEEALDPDARVRLFERIEATALQIDAILPHLQLQLTPAQYNERYWLGFGKALIATNKQDFFSSYPHARAAIMAQEASIFLKKTSSLDDIR